MSITPNIEEAIRQADIVRAQYNPDGVSPFPYENIEKNNTDLNILYVDVTEDGISGATSFDKEHNVFNIFINTLKPKTRQYFTLAHELGHYFLHKDIIKKEEIVIDGDKTLDGGKILFRLDDIQSNNLETEANNFAANLIMPKDLVVEAWQKLSRVEDCASIFNVSTIAMAIRLEKLGLRKEE